MRICIDARNPANGGTYTYIVSLLRAMFREPRSDYEFTVLYDDLHGPLGLQGVKERVIRGHRGAEILLWGQLGLPNLLQRERVDLYHSLKHLSSPRTTAKTVFTIHSTCQYLFPKAWAVHELIYWSWGARTCARKADLLIALSQEEKRNLIRFAGAEERKVLVVNLAAQDRFGQVSNGTESLAVKRKLGLPDRYILYVGNIYPVKNVETIVRAYHRLVAEHDIEESLVLTGGNVYRSNRVFHLIDELGIRDRVLRTGFIKDELPQIYRQASLFVFPSLYEAFCLPPIEAMSSGVPVVTSNAGGVPEVVGDAAIMVEPRSVTDLAEAMLQVLRDPALRRDLVQRGLDRAAGFSWDRCARETVASYGRVLSGCTNGRG